MIPAVRHVLDLQFESVENIAPTMITILSQRRYFQSGRTERLRELFRVSRKCRVAAGD
ncbi:MAG TPA: hypothetical protein VNQ76_05175 [Planctomicrobium sp.]|nr:hypothetical protein [Planctomicrobium sp.]